MITAYAMVFALSIGGALCLHQATYNVTESAGRLIARRLPGIFGVPSICSRQAAPTSRLYQLRLAVLAQGVGHDRVHELADLATERSDFAHQRR